MAIATCDRVALFVRRKVGLAPEDELSVDAPLLNGGVWLDSVMVLELLLELEDEFGVELAAEELQKAGAMDSCASLARFIDAKRTGA
jgi:acyl carrier protein